MHRVSFALNYPNIDKDAETENDMWTIYQETLFSKFALHKFYESIQSVHHELAMKSALRLDQITIKNTYNLCILIFVRQKNNI